jgi:hypothetical protein
VEEASIESFPASDPPGWVPVHAGLPASLAQHLSSDPEAQDIWNSALEAAARQVERSADAGPRGGLAADIRAMKQAGKQAGPSRP